MAGTRRRRRAHRPAPRGLAVTTSHEVAPEIREYEPRRRRSNAYIKPLARQYLDADGPAGSPVSAFARRCS